MFLPFIHIVFLLPNYCFQRLHIFALFFSSSFCSFGGGRLSLSFPLVLFGLGKGIGDFFAAVGGTDEDEECAADDDEAKRPG